MCNFALIKIFTTLREPRNFGIIRTTFFLLILLTMKSLLKFRTNFKVKAVISPNRAIVYVKDYRSIFLVRSEDVINYISHLNKCDYQNIT